MLNRIKELRKNLRMTQMEFGEKIGVKGNTITNYETGLRNPSEAVVKSICREFNVNEDWLRTGEGEMFIEMDRDEEIVAWASRITRSDYDNEFVQNFAHMLTRLDEEDWKVLEKMALLMADKKKD
ncbi:MAG: helix-turn-helix domain-containing protein [Blautia sp.]|jgi:transcriptional regulator with XRE-family HTH domain